MNTAHNAETTVRSMSPRKADIQYFKGVPVTLTTLDPAEMGQIEDPRSEIVGVCTVPVTLDGRIVLARLRRGLEIPGGGIEAGDRELADTARREAWEEARVRVGYLELVQLIRVDRRDVQAPARYIVIFAGRVTSMPAFERKHESLGRLLVSPADYIAIPGCGTIEQRRLLVSQVMTALAGHDHDAIAG